MKHRCIFGLQLRVTTLTGLSHSKQRWPPLEVEQRYQKLLSLERMIQELMRRDEEEVANELARLLVVRTCGYLEQAIEICAREHLTAKSAPTAAAFGASWLGKGANPNPDFLVKYAYRFEGSWGKEIYVVFNADDELLKREISFLVDRRNKISHGASEGVGVRKALDLLKHASKIADWFIDKLNPFSS